MNQKILIGSIFTALLLLTMPFVSAMQEQQTDTYLTKTSEPQIPEPQMPEVPEELIRDLQYVHDNIAENYPEEFDEGFLQDFQDNINALSYPLLTCMSLLAITIILAAITVTLGELGFMVLALSVYALMASAMIVAIGLDCAWTKIPPYSDFDAVNYHIHIQTMFLSVHAVLDEVVNQK